MACAAALRRRARTVLVLVARDVRQFYAYDAVAPLADHLQRLLGFTDTQIGTLNAIYSLPNVIMVLIGGIIVDRIGTRRATFIFTAICLAGALLTAASSAFWVMAGAVCCSASARVDERGGDDGSDSGSWAAARFRVRRQLGIARPATRRTCRRRGRDRSTTLAAAPPARAGLVAFSLVAAGVYFVFERSASRRFNLVRADSERFVWGDLLKFDRSYWYVVGLCVTFYSVIFPFRSTFAIKYFQHAHGMSLQDAGTMNGYVFLAAIFATPAFGLLIDKVGRRALFMAGGTLLLLIVFPILGLSRMNLWVSTVLIGIAFSLVPAVMWPAVTYLVKPSQLGTAYGLMTMLQNIGLAVFNVGAGWLNDTARAGPDNPDGYLPMLWLFGLLSLSGLSSPGCSAGVKSAPTVTASRRSRRGRSSRNGPKSPHAKDAKTQMLLGNGSSPKHLA